MLLKTPLGNVYVELNGVLVDYTFESLPTTMTGTQGHPLFNVDSRYKITPNLSTVEKLPFSIKCRIEVDTVMPIDSELETGERYSAVSIIADNHKFCIGGYDELDGLELHDFADSALELNVEKRDCMKYAYFCIAWTKLRGKDFNTNGENDTWYAAEPYMCEEETLSGRNYCLKLYSPEKIIEWTDNRRTAICPYCSVDSVIGVSGDPVQATKFLQTMKKEKF